MSGTERTRPSVNVTRIISSLKETDFANADVGTKARRGLGFLLAEMLMPGLQQFLLMVLNQSLNLIQITSVKSIVYHKVDRVKPELAFIARGLDVNVRWFSPLVTEKEKAEATDPQDRRRKDAVEAWFTPNAKPQAANYRPYSGYIVIKHSSGDTANRFRIRSH